MAREKDPVLASDEHNARGIELADRGWIDEAMKEFRKAIELDPKAAHAHDNLAGCHVEKKQFREALREYLTAIELEPEAPQAHYNLGLFLSSHGMEFTVSQFKESIELEPDFSDAHLNLGMCLADQGKFDEAKKSIQTAIDLDPKDGFARHELASLLMDQGDFRQAINQLKEVVRLEPENFDAHLDLGVCYAQKGFYEEAERAYTKAEALQGDKLLLHYNQAALLCLWKRPADSKAMLGKALALDAEKVRGWLKQDPMFDALHGDAEFEKLAQG